MPVNGGHRNGFLEWAGKMLVLLLGLMPIAAWSQEPQYVSDVAPEINVEDALTMFLNEATDLETASKISVRMTDYSTLSDYYVQVLNSQWEETNTDYQFFDFRWNTFVQANQDEIADDDNLASQLAEVRQTMQNVRDTLEQRKAQLQAMSDFLDAERIVLGKDSIYKRLYRTAFELSLTKNTAPKLESCKAQEQILFQKMETAYTKAKAAIAVVPGLQCRMAALEESFFKIKGVSQQIQAMAYKPFIQRIKDYLIGLTCLAILLMFVNMIHSKIKAAKQVRDSMKQYREVMNRNNMGEYPTI